MKVDYKQQELYNKRKGSKSKFHLILSRSRRFVLATLNSAIFGLSNPMVVAGHDPELLYLHQLRGVRVAVRLEVEDGEGADDVCVVEPALACARLERHHLAPFLHTTVNRIDKMLEEIVVERLKGQMIGIEKNRSRRAESKVERTHIADGGVWGKSRLSQPDMHVTCLRPKDAARREVLADEVLDLGVLSIIKGEVEEQVLAMRVQQIAVAEWVMLHDEDADIIRVRQSLHLLQPVLEPIKGATRVLVQLRLRSHTCFRKSRFTSHPVQVQHIKIRIRRRKFHQEVVMPRLVSEVSIHATLLRPMRQIGLPIGLAVDQTIAIHLGEDLVSDRRIGLVQTSIGVIMIWPCIVITQQRKPSKKIDERRKICIQIKYIYNIFKTFYKLDTYGIDSFKVCAIIS